jgi:hypothetical protein
VVNKLRWPRAGGAFDVWARVIANFLGKNVPGGSTFVVQKMSGEDRDALIKDAGVPSQELIQRLKRLMEN